MKPLTFPSAERAQSPQGPQDRTAEGLPAESRLVELMRRGMICKEALGWGPLCLGKRNPAALRLLDCRSSSPRGFSGRRRWGSPGWFQLSLGVCIESPGNFKTADGCCILWWACIWFHLVESVDELQRLWRVRGCAGVRKGWAEVKSQPSGVLRPTVMSGQTLTEAILQARHHSNHLGELFYHGRSW